MLSYELSKPCETLPCSPEISWHTPRPIFRSHFTPYTIHHILAQHRINLTRNWRFVRPNEGKGVPLNSNFPNTNSALIFLEWGEVEIGLGWKLLDRILVGILRGHCKYLVERTKFSSSSDEYIYYCSNPKDSNFWRKLISEPQGKFLKLIFAFSIFFFSKRSSILIPVFKFIVVYNWGTF